MIYFGSSTDNLITTDRSPKNENTVEEVTNLEVPSKIIKSNTFSDGNPVKGKTYPESNGVKPVGDKHTLIDFGIGDTDSLGRIQYKDKLEDAHPNSVKRWYN